MTAAQSQPPPLDSRAIRKQLAEIKEAQDEQSDIEAQRTGAGKLTAKLVTLFGAIITAAAVGGFVWVWDAQASNARQDSDLRHIIERTHEHDPAPLGHGEITAAQRATERRVDGLEAAQSAVNARLDRADAKQTRRHQDLMEAIRRVRSRR